MHCLHATTIDNMSKQYNLTDEEWGNRLVVTPLNEDGTPSGPSTYGPTLRERHTAHVEGECDSMCGFCYQEACEILDAEKANT